MSVSSNSPDVSGVVELSGVADVESGAVRSSVRIVGPGRAGRALAAALRSAGWRVEPMVGRGDPVRSSAAGVAFCVIAAPDDGVAEIAASIEPVNSTTLVHLSGSLAPDVLGAHERRGAMHPLVSLTGEGSAGALQGAYFAVSGDPGVEVLVAALGGRSVPVAAHERMAHHAACCVAANHLVTLMAQVERLAPAGVPLEAYLDLARGAIQNVERLGPAGALTGPAVRGDETTIAGHLAAMPATERELYTAMLEATRTLAAAGETPTS